MVRVARIGVLALLAGLIAATQALASNVAFVPAPAMLADDFTALASPACSGQQLTNFGRTLPQGTGALASGGTPDRATQFGADDPRILQFAIKYAF